MELSEELGEKWHKQRRCHIVQQKSSTNDAWHSIIGIYPRCHKDLFLELRFRSFFHLANIQRAMTVSEWPRWGSGGVVVSACVRLGADGGYISWRPASIKALLVGQTMAISWPMSGCYSLETEH